MRYVIVMLVFSLFSPAVLALSCVALPLSQFAMQESAQIVAFNVLSVNPANALKPASLDIEITKDIISDLKTQTRLRIDNISPFVIDGFKKNTEWLSALTKTGNHYVLEICTPILAIEKGFIINETGLRALDSAPTKPTLESFKLALSTYRQGLAAADQVCKSQNSFCAETKAVYDIETGVLMLPTVQYLWANMPTFAKAKLQKTSDKPMSFSVIEIK